MDLKILLWNAKGWRDKKEELCVRCQKYDINVITEIKGKNNEIFKVSGYKTLIKNRISSNNRGIEGVAIIVKNNVLTHKHKLNLNNVTELDAAGITINNIIDLEKLTIIGIYRRPDNTTDRHTWNKIYKSCSGLDNIILMGDFNAHHTSWNCHDVDKNGEII